jgi:hypothetical protein
MDFQLSALQDLDPKVFDALLAQISTGAFFATQDDTLRVTVLNGAAGVTLNIRYRGLDVQGRPPTSADTVIPATNRTASTTIVRLPIGWIFGGSIFAAAGSPVEGQCYVVVDLMRGEGTAATVHQTLAQGYVTTTKKLAFPGSPLLAPTEGPGALRAIVGTAPGAGVEISEVVPTNARWQLLAFQSRLVTGAAVANRNPELTIDDGANEYMRGPSLAAIPASTTIRPSWAPGCSHQVSSSAAPGAWIVSLGDEVFLPSGGHIKTVTQNIQAADQWDAPRYLVREWIDVS